MKLRTQHFLQVDVVIVVLIVAFLLLLGRLAAETSGAIAVGRNEDFSHQALSLLISGGRVRPATWERRGR